ncbi:MAG: outer membrane beta-barrel protein [Fibrobacter sp.]|nr:outer membrane beta-barrel protein [Fibrobacter sp.]
MKKFLFTLFAAVTLLCTQAMADEHWPKTYFIEVGWGLAYSTGDLNSTTLHTKDTLDKKLDIYMPDLGLLTAPDFTVGVNIWAFTLAVNFNYWKGNTELSKFENDDEVSTRMWRLGLEFTYNLLYPDNFQIGLGGGYSYTNVKTKDSALDAHGDSMSSEIMGSGLALVANVRYYFTKNLVLAPTIKIFGNWFKDVYTTRSEIQDVTPYMWQTFFFASISFQYQF